MKAKIGSRLLETIRPSERPFEVCDTEVQGFILRVQPSGIMAYFCSYRLRDGRRNRVRLGPTSILTPAQARDQAKRILADVLMGTDPAATRRLARAHCLGTFLTERYLPWAKEHRKSGVTSVKRIEACFTEFLPKPLSEITAWSVEKWRTERLRANLKKATINRDLAAFSAALSKAVEWGVLLEHPLARVRPLRVDDACAKVRFLDDTEEAGLRFALDAREASIRAARRSANEWRRARDEEEYPDLDLVSFADHLKPMVLLSLSTGIRRGELFDLTWDHVILDHSNPKHSYIIVAARNSKSGKARNVPLNSEAFSVLKDWQTQGSSTEGLVFPSATGERFNNVNSSWEAILQVAKITNFRWHDMRHHFASRLVMAGVDLNTVRELLGHADIKMSLKYAHLAPAVKAAAVAKLDRVPMRSIAHVHQG